MFSDLVKTMAGTVSQCLGTDCVYSYQGGGTENVRLTPAQEPQLDETDGRVITGTIETVLAPKEQFSQTPDEGDTLNYDGKDWVVEYKRDDGKASWIMYLRLV